MRPDLHDADTAHGTPRAHNVNMGHREHRVTGFRQSEICIGHSIDFFSNESDRFFGDDSQEDD